MDDMRVFGTIAMAMLCASCGGPDDASQAPPAANAVSNASMQATKPPLDSEAQEPSERWDLQSSGEGVALALMRGNDRTVLRLFCPAGKSELLVNVPDFRPIGSEERLSFGGQGDVVALVADVRGDTGRGGVSGVGAVPGNLTVLVSSPLSASYGAQTSGPHPAPPAAMARAFVTACNDTSTGQTAPDRQQAPTGNACLMQGKEQLRVMPRRAVGTEPFWGARIEGRCVNYSHPEDQKGTRVWTRYSKGPGGEIWSGALNGQIFELRIQTAPGCSDGMSDTVYPLSATLKVGGEDRKGCAEPA